MNVSAVRLLSVRHVDGSGSALEANSQAHRRRYRSVHQQYLSVRPLTRAFGRPFTRLPKLHKAKRTIMSEILNLRRREFIVSALAAGGVLVIGTRPGVRGRGLRQVHPSWDRAAGADSAEFTPWILIAPDDTVTVRVTTPDIGNGTLTQAAALSWKNSEHLGTKSRSNRHRRIAISGRGGCLFQGRRLSRLFQRPARRTLRAWQPTCRSPPAPVNAWKSGRWPQMGCTSIRDRGKQQHPGSCPDGSEDTLRRGGCEGSGDHPR